MDFKQIAENSKASQDKFEQYQMLHAISQLQPKKILEIGVHTGENLRSFGYAFPLAELYGIECENRHLIFRSFNHINGDSTDSTIIDAAKRNAPYDFIFIDGDHRYETVKADWENYRSMVRPGGAIGFHDTSRMGEGWMSKVEVRKLLDEIWKDNSYACSEFWNGRENPGIVIIWL